MVQRRGTTLDQCDINDLTKPENALNWSCDVSIEDEKVPKGTKCEIICRVGFEAVSGENH